jgi:tetratricopeptide (TPR) repeat protein
MRRFASALPILLALAVAPASAQETGSPRHGPAAPKAADGEKPADPRGASLEELYDRLAKAGDESEGKGIAALIERRWSRSGSDTADLLMSRAAEAADRKDYPLAVELLDRVLALEPGWAEAWYRRANVFYLLDDPVSALADLRRTLDLEPRHFGAWTGLGHILMSSEDKPHALAAYRRALQIYPQLSVVQTLVERLAPQVDGQDL